MQWLRLEESIFKTQMAAHFLASSFMKRAESCFKSDVSEERTR